jgi:hypothetical protein
MTNAINSGVGLIKTARALLSRPGDAISMNLSSSKASGQNNRLSVVDKRSSLLQRELSGDYTTLTASGVANKMGGGAYSADDSVLLVRRDSTASPNSHGIRDESAWTAASGAGGYASYDAAAVFAGAAPYDHLHGFQSRPSYAGSVTINRLAGFWSQIDASGTVDNAFGLLIKDPSGAGTITVNYGIYVEAQTRGATNYAIYTAGTAACQFGGDMNCSGNNIIGSASGLAKCDIYGGNSGDGAGAATYYRNYTTISFAVGHKSAIVGGAYNAQPFLYTAGVGVEIDGGISCTNGTFAGTAPGTPSAGQVLIGGGNVSAAGSITAGGAISASIDSAAVGPFTLIATASDTVGKTTGFACVNSAGGSLAGFAGEVVSVGNYPSSVGKGRVWVQNGAGTTTAMEWSASGVTACYGTAPGIPSAGQVLIGGGNVSAAGQIYCGGPLAVEVTSANCTLALSRPGVMDWYVGTTSDSALSFANGIAAYSDAELTGAKRRLAVTTNGIAVYGSAPGTPSAGQVLIGGGNVAAAGTITAGYLEIQDTTTMASGVGGRLVFSGKYTTSGDIAYFGECTGRKVNGTSG